MASTLFWVAVVVCSVSLVQSMPKREQRRDLSKRQYDYNSYYGTPDPYFDNSGSGWYDPYNDYSGSGWNDPYNDYSGSGWYDPYNDYSGSGWNEPYNDYSGSGWYDPYDYSGSGDYNWGSCGYGQMQCIDKQCVDVTNICDGYWSCNKGEDELFCSDYASAMTYYKKRATKRNMVRLDENALKMRVYNEVRNRHAKKRLIARKMAEKAQRRHGVEDLKDLLMRKLTKKYKYG